MVYYASHNQYLEPEDVEPPDYRRCESCGAFLPIRPNHVMLQPSHVEYTYDETGISGMIESGPPLYIMQWKCKRCGDVRDEIDAGTGCPDCGALWERVEQGWPVTTREPTCPVSKMKEEASAETPQAPLKGQD